MDINVGILVQGGMLLGLGAVARVLYNTTVLCGRIEERVAAQKERLERVEERVDDLAS